MPHRSDVLVVPVGATEQHGAHLPYTTDTDIAMGLAERLDDVNVAPPVAYGNSGEHQAFAGTLSIGSEATELLLIELARSASRTWPRILLLNTHGGNVEPVRRAVERLQAESRDVRSWSPSWGGDAHAGHVETSIMLALSPARVDMARASAGATAPLRELLPAMRSGGVATVSPNGVLGDPTTATAAAGHAFLAQAHASLTELLGAWA